MVFTDESFLGPLVTVVMSHSLFKILSRKKSAWYHTMLLLFSEAGIEILPFDQLRVSYYIA